MFKVNSFLRKTQSKRWLQFSAGVETSHSVGVPAHVLVALIASGQCSYKTDKNRLEAENDSWAHGYICRSGERSQMSYVKGVSLSVPADRHRRPGNKADT